MLYVIENFNLNYFDIQSAIPIFLEAHISLLNQCFFGKNSPLYVGKASFLHDVLYV